MPYPPLIEALRSLLNEVPLSAFIYASGSDRYYDCDTHQPIKAGTCVGIRFGEGATAPIILFKGATPLKDNPRKLKKALDMAAKLNILEGVQKNKHWLDYFYQDNVDLTVNIKK